MLVQTKYFSDLSRPNCFPITRLPVDIYQLMSIWKYVQIFSIQETELSFMFFGLFTMRVGYFFSQIHTILRKYIIQSLKGLIYTEDKVKVGREIVL